MARAGAIASTEAAGGSEQTIGFIAASGRQAAAELSASLGRSSFR